ncbi:MAG TPA: LacI family transcriptional regulator [Chloroflexi bacterium]|nr:LacI family transcriptional regulator [Chloroflexota bacterium]
MTTAPDHNKITSRRPVSIQDIATVAGVSHSTVSRALHNSELISPEVRQRIQQLAQAMGYTPNAVAQSLKGQRTDTVGLVITSIADPFAGRAVRGIEEVAQANHVSLLLSVSHNDPEREMEIIETFHRRRVDGVISATAQLRGAYLQRLTQMKMPTVFINQQADSEADRLHSVDADDYDGARQAVSHLLALGHRKIGYLGVGNRAQSNRRRFAGYCDTLSAAGIAVDAQWVRIAPTMNNLRADDVLDGQAMLPALLPSGVTAVFCYNDQIAVGALMACRELGIAVPEQLSVVGYDDVDLARYVTPPLTTIHQPKLRLGEIAMQMLLDILEGKPVQSLILPVELVVRQSAAPPRTGAM